MEHALELLRTHFSLMRLSLLVRRPVLLVQYTHHRTYTAVEADAQFFGELMQAGFDIVQRLQPFGIGMNR